MRDREKRPKGKYIKVFTKEKNGIAYTKTETIVVGRDFEIMNIQNEYMPGIIFPMTWEEI